LLNIYLANKHINYLIALSFSKDYNLTGGVNITTKNILSLNPDGKVGIESLNISGIATLNKSVTCISSLNVSGITTLSNNTNIIGT
jgi:hypothetical protein